MKHIVGIFALLLIISGCTSYGINNTYHVYESYQLKLIQPIPVKAGSSYAYITAPGKIVSRGDIKTHELYCKFSMPRSKNSDATTIVPDTFEINNIYRRYSNTFPGFSDSYQVAFGGFGRGIFSQHRSSRQDLELFLEIDSVNQPHIKSISCIRFADPYIGNSPTLEEVEAVLTGLAEFKPA